MLPLAPISSAADFLAMLNRLHSDVTLQGLICSLTVLEGTYALSPLVISSQALASEVTIRAVGDVRLQPSAGTSSEGGRLLQSSSHSQALMQILRDAPPVRMYGLRFQNSTGAPAVESRGSSVHMEACSFVHNDGGAVVVGTASIERPDFQVHATMRSCEFRDNGHPSGSNGGAIRAHWRVEIYNSTFAGNRALNGGAMWIGDEAIVQVRTSLFNSNEANQATGRGGAIFIDGNALVALGDQTSLLANTASAGRSVFLSTGASASYVLYRCCASNLTSLTLALRGCCSFPTLQKSCSARPLGLKHHFVPDGYRSSYEHLVFSQRDTDSLARRGPQRQLSLPMRARFCR
jgi:hypothetical protein